MISLFNVASVTEQLVALHSGSTSVFPCPTFDLQLMGDHYYG